VSIMKRSRNAMLLSNVKVGPLNISKNWTSPFSKTLLVRARILGSFRIIFRKGVFWLPLKPHRFSFIEISI
jgi:hypothetical protein